MMGIIKLNFDKKGNFPKLMPSIGSPFDPDVAAEQDYYHFKKQMVLPSNNLMADISIKENIAPHDLYNNKPPLRKRNEDLNETTEYYFP